MYIYKKLSVKGFLEIELNNKINFRWKEIVDILPFPCIICKYGETSFEYSNKAAVESFRLSEPINSFKIGRAHV